MRFIGSMLCGLIALLTSAHVDAAPLVGFTSTAKTDLFGYYMPRQPVRCGGYKLITIDFGVPSDFRMFQKNPSQPGAASPIGLTFAPAVSRQKAGPEGGMYWEGSFRVFPSAYRVTDGTVALAATDKRLGALSFNGTLDIATLKSVRKGPPPYDRVVMTGDLVIGTCVQRNFAFTWFLGD